MPVRNYKSSFSKQIIAEKNYASYRHWFHLSHGPGGFGGSEKSSRSKRPPPRDQNLQPNAGGEEAAVKRVVDGIMQPYLAQGERTAGGHAMESIASLGNDRGGFAARPSLLLPVSEQQPMQALRSRAKPWLRSAPAPRLSPPRCLHWPSTATKSWLTLPLRNTCPTATGSGRSRLTPLELADFTSGMPDDPTNLPRETRTAKHRVLHGKRLSHLGFKLRTEDSIACAL